MTRATLPPASVALAVNVTGVPAATNVDDVVSETEGGVLPVGGGRIGGPDDEDGEDKRGEDEAGWFHGVISEVSGRGFFHPAGWRW